VAPIATWEYASKPQDAPYGWGGGITFAIPPVQASRFNKYTAGGEMNSPLQRKALFPGGRAAVSSPPLVDVLALVGDAVSWSKRLASRAAAGSAATVRTPDDWALFLALPRAARRERVRVLHRSLAAAHRMRQFVWDGDASLDRALERLSQISTRARTPVWAARIPSLLPRSWFRLYCVEIAGEIAAMALCYAAHKRAFVLQAAADPAYARWSLEALLLGFAHEHAVGQGDDVTGFLPT
jgi:hypothetical protein